MKHFFYLTSLVLLLASCQKQVWTNPNLSPERRAELLLQELTLEEKVTLMTDVSDAIPRLGIPTYNWWNEALHGVARAGLATVFPQSIGMAASFDQDAVFDVFTAVSDEARAKNTKAVQDSSYRRYQGLTFWTPNINIFRDPRWGRGQETYGEDPYLTAMLGVEVVRGLQGPADSKYDKLHACAKHFAVHSGPEWNRHEFDAENISPRDLYETYLPAFKALVTEADVKEIMCAYNAFEGDPCCGSDQLLMQILRNEWGYKHLVVSDCGAISDFFRPNAHQTHPDAASASADAVLTGTDLNCGSSYKALVEAVNKGLLTEEQLNVSVKRLLTARFALGELDDPALVEWTKIPYSVVASAEHDALATEMARKSMVLLQNKNNVLPLQANGLTVAVVGPNANDSVMQWANYNGTPARTITILQGIKNAVGEENVIYEEGCAWVADTLNGRKINPQAIAQRVQSADVIIFVGGITPRLEGEEMRVNWPGFRGGDRTDIELPAIQRQVVAALHNTGKPVVFVNCSGSALGLVPETETCDAILQAWYPGQSGGTAVADILFGKYNPAGRLPVTFYKNISQLPDFENYDMKGHTYRYNAETPLFPFGYGLSYTTFDYGVATFNMENPKAGQEIVLTVPVTNSGDRDGEEVVQVYLKKANDLEGPIKTLRAFKRVVIPAGQTLQVEIPLTSQQLEWWNADTNTMHTGAGLFEVMVGGSSRDSDLKRYELSLL